MHSREIRQSFLDFFAAKSHTIVRSAPVIPADDPTLLFTNAGMNQFKDVFLAKGTRPYTRAADTQKCIRASGKHNDLEDVGRDTYHHTFFEMLGNWSFGDYYKEEAISWAWELLTEVWKLPADRLYATVYHDDDESARIWAEKTSIEPSHILRFGDKDNFWEMGETGPCGPCSEIHIDLTPDGSGKELVNAGDHRAIELWNLVFIQYDRQPDGRLEPLPQRHVDTGMGFERVCAVMQSKASNYDTDVFLPLFQRLSELTGVTYGASMDGRQDIAMRVIADHARTLTFALSDGAMPSNEGRGYVLRRILRRALRYSRDLGCSGPILHQLVGTLADSMGDVFGELRDRRDAVERIIRAEEESFITTLDRGMEIFGELAAATARAGGRMLKGEDAFKLYDTYGFPFDLTRLLATEAGLDVDGEGFEHCMQEQKSRARSDRREKQQTGDGAGSWQWFSDSHATTFLGYDRLAMPSTIIGAAHASGHLLLVLAETPFYAESGGQTGDRGWLESAAYRMQVTDTRKDGDSFVHVVSRAFDKVRDTEIDPMDIVIEEATPVDASVERILRQETERNHTATHLLHAALRRILGSHVQQKGSFVTSERLRFDFSHFSKMTPEEIQAVEAEVNEHIRCAAHVSKHADLPYDEAIAKGALAFFGDKYAERVRMVEVPGISAELCGGTHVDNIGQIGIFKIISESSAAAGIRRIEALTGRAAEMLLWKEYHELQDVRQQLKLKADEAVAEKLAELQEEKKELEKELAGLKSASVIDALVRDATSAEEIGGCRIVTKVLEGVDADTLRSAAMALREKLPVSAGLLCSIADGKVSLAAFSSDVAVKEKGIDAGKLIRLAAAAVKGGGGGRAELATAGGKNPDGVAEACRIFAEDVRRIAGAV
ncbi:alanine--tRNA ligase [Pelodictyon luteolum]|uniref:Alanine--tRNA ligase n=1 Tax=Chlorobium luteolum (strain DSM 273 / BCRC 81028 / 2530) TaxID=319225 RepID=SYA_CHLL3|nr:alanine--tRNA ligase [Pelodictyon luteolum]Q3B1I7.1 RecName: Full=Alanine--tRNA ligase; AltName: Full=Alanyl-tRNA synthetase; Short=AlaRS [Pelodictyon luteolum DSM 273]ABB24794.1 alanyl-tRNA synthetase [Pelodictyon luteolum DSM 273]